jgi:hypothetical protein
LFRNFFRNNFYCSIVALLGIGYVLGGLTFFWYTTCCQKHVIVNSSSRYEPVQNPGRPKNSFSTWVALAFSMQKVGNIWVVFRKSYRLSHVSKKKCVENSKYLPFLEPKPSLCTQIHRYLSTLATVYLRYFRNSLGSTSQLAGKILFFSPDNRRIE